MLNEITQFIICHWQGAICQICAAGVRNLWWVRSAHVQWGSGGCAPSEVQGLSPRSEGLGWSPRDADEILVTKTPYFALKSVCIAWTISNGKLSRSAWISVLHSNILCQYTLDMSLQKNQPQFYEGEKHWWIVRQPIIGRKGHAEYSYRPVIGHVHLTILSLF